MANLIHFLFYFKKIVVSLHCLIETKMKVNVNRGNDLHDFSQIVDLCEMHENFYAQRKTWNENLFYRFERNEWGIFIRMYIIENDELTLVNKLNTIDIKDATAKDWVIGTIVYESVDDILRREIPKTLLSEDEFKHLKSLSSHFEKMKYLKPIIQGANCGLGLKSCAAYLGLYEDEDYE